MKFECDSCNAQYMIADEKVGKRGVKVKCKKCAHVIIVRPGGQTSKAKSKPSTNDVDTEVLPAVRTPPPSELHARSEGNNHTAVGPAPPGADADLGELGNDDPFAALPPAGDVAAPDDGGPHDVPAPPALFGIMATTGGDMEPAQPPEGSTDPRFAAPAPVSMFGDQTMLTGKHDVTENLVYEKQAVPPPPPAPPPPDKTELGVMPQLSSELESNDRRLATATVVSQQPEMSVAPAAPVTGAQDLDDELAGAFGAMFDSSAPMPDGGEQNPTRVLDASAMDSLRQRALHDGAPAPQQLQTGPDPRELERGLVAKGADDGPAEIVWHVAIDDQDVGPLALGELGRHIESGRVDRDSLVWKVGMDDWLPAGDVTEVRALFEKQPRISRYDEAVAPARDKKDLFGGKFDVGMPIDDVPQADRGASSFGPPPSPFDEDDNEASWRPHGLTDVYQAANLAEAAAGGMGGSLGSIASSSNVSAFAAASGGTGLGLSAKSSVSDGEWRPGAAGALASLVQDEIKRLQKPLPAADDSVPAADDASINAPLFSGIGSFNTDLDNGGEVSDAVATQPKRAPTMNAMPAVSYDAAAGYAGVNGNGNGNVNYPAPGFGGGFGAGGFASTAPTDAKSKLPLWVAGGVSVTLLVALVVGAMVLLRPSGGLRPGDVVKDADGKPAFVVTSDGSLQSLAGGRTSAPKDTPAVVVADATQPPPSTTAPSATAPSATAPSATAPSSTAPSATVADVVAPGASVAVEPKERKTNGRKTKADVKADKVEDKPPPEDKVVAKKKTDCDPVLDFDCKANPATAKKDPPADLKDTLSKADVLTVIKAGVSGVEACGRKNKVQGQIKMSFKVLTSGRTTDVQVADSKYAGTPIGTCVTGAIKGWKFPAHKTAISPVTFPFKLP